MSARFTTALATEEIDELANLHRVIWPLVYYSDILGRRLDVPAGFVTDFASVPRLPVVYLAAGGRGDRAAVIHDWLYSTRMVDRATADAVLREALLACGYGPVLANLFYAAVRIFGRGPWDAPNRPQPAAVAALLAISKAASQEAPKC